jgi:hypothetical protein
MVNVKPTACTWFLAHLIQKLGFVISIATLIWQFIFISQPYYRTEKIPQVDHNEIRSKEWGSESIKEKIISNIVL